MIQPQQRQTNGNHFRFKGKDSLFTKESGWANPVKYLYDDLVSHHGRQRATAVFTQTCEHINYACHLHWENNDFVSRTLVIKIKSFYIKNFT